MLYIKIVAFVFLVLFYVIYSLKMMLLKRQNIKGNILGKGNKPLNSYVVEIILRFVTFLCIPVQFISVIFDMRSLNIHSIAIIKIIGLVLMSAAVALFLLAIITMKNNWRAGYNHEQDTQLVTNGIYKFSRNPAFVGFDLLYIGGALAFPNIINIIISLMGVVLFHIQILGEEKFLTNKFGDTYTTYKAKVRRYF